MTVDGRFYTEAELKAMFPSSSDAIRLSWALAATHKERLRCVHLAMDHIAQDMTKTRQHRQGRSEDELSIEVISALTYMGITATHDTQYGGHCDIVVESKASFLWLGEAKIHSAYDWLYQGFEQLGTRYSTGLAGQDAGGLIIYCYSGRIDRIMCNWKSHLVSKYQEITIEDCADNDLAFISVHPHPITGRSFRVRHMPFALQFSPRV